MRLLLLFLMGLTVQVSISQTNLPQDYLSSDFHKGRRDALRTSMPKNSVAIFFAAATRNRSNDVEYIYHQDPNFHYLTGYNEPHAVLLIFSDQQSNGESTFNELIFVQKRNELYERWMGRRLGVEGVQSNLGFNNVYNGEGFVDFPIDFSSFDKILFTDFKNDVRNSGREKPNLYTLIEQFKTKVNYSAGPTEVPVDGQFVEVKTNIDVVSLQNLMGGLREIKSKDELKLIKKAVEISCIGQIEIMKAMHPEMSELEIQGVHEFVYKKYGAEYEGYPSIVGAGNNGCILHYIDNTRTKSGSDLVLMDLGAEYHGYTADVTRTIPANGKFSKEQKIIYDLVYEAQEAGIAETVIGSNTRRIDKAGRDIINQGLLDLGIIDSLSHGRNYFPHGTSHHIGLDVHDLNTRGELKENMIITVEPGIYIPEGSPCDKKWWGIAVRIEDDILITTNGPVNFSALAPRKSEEIEKMMLGKSVFDDFILPDLGE